MSLTKLTLNKLKKSSIASSIMSKYGKYNKTHPITQFQIVNDLRERLLHSRPLTPPLEDVGFNYGFNTNYLTKVLDYWKNNYNFKEQEQFLNKYKHFVTNIQGLDIHYMHVKPKVSANVTVSIWFLLKYI